MPTLNIKDPEVYELASELARRRGTSMTGASEALLDALERNRLTRRLHPAYVRARQATSRLDEPFLTDDDLYDEWGLPR